MKRIAFFLALLFAAVAWADCPLYDQSFFIIRGYKVLPYYQECVVDTLMAWTDTLNYQVPVGAEFFGVHVRFDTTGAFTARTDTLDSLSIKYRSLPNYTWVEYGAGSSFIPVPLRKADGTTTTFFTTASPAISGYAYCSYDSTRVNDFLPIAGNILQFLVATAKDTVKVQFCPVFRYGGGGH